MMKDNTVNNVSEKPPQQKPAGGPPRPPPGQEPKGLAFALIIVAVMSSLFLVALDRTILATAIPVITDQFHSLNDVIWYAGAYLITSCATQLLWGRIYSFYNTKYVTIFSIILFEVGSAICGAAPNSIALIIGRAIAGMGSAALYTGTTVIIIGIIPLAKRPVYMALLGGVFGVASVAGPLLGGAFTDRVSWRWCFYINLPIGCVSAAMVLFLLKLEGPSQRVPLKDQFFRLDPLGTILFLPSIICLLLALQWGGVQYAWGSGRIIALFVLFGVLMTAFWVVQYFLRENATVQLRIIKQRSVLAGTIFSMFIGGALVTMLYWIAIWFQAVKGVSAVHSGIDTLPLVLSLTVANLTCGPLVRKFGYYQPPMYLSCVLMSIGAGLVTTFNVNTSTGEWIGYQILFGFGLGLGMQQASLAAQNSLGRADISVGVSLMFFGQSFGGAVFNAIAQAVFDHRLASGVATISGLDAGTILRTGATNLRSVIPSGDLEKVLVVYNEALRQCFYVVTAASAVMIIPTLAIEWKKLQGPPGGKPGQGPPGGKPGQGPPSQGSPSHGPPSHGPPGNDHSATPMEPTRSHSVVDGEALSQKESV